MASPSSPEMGIAPYEGTPVPPLVPAPPSYEPAAPSYEPTTPRYEPTTPSYEPTTPSYEPTTPGYEPTTPRYEPTTPEVLDFRAEALRLINSISERDNARALERYAGQKPLGALSGALRLFRLRDAATWVDNAINNPISKALAPIYTYLDRIGQRSISNDEELSVEENLENAGNYTKTPWWRKALKIGAKIAGGAGVAGAMIMTGGVGAATSLLWAGGLKEAYDGVAQTIEQVGWGNKRASAELCVQGELSRLTDELKARVTNEAEPLTREQFTAMVQNIIQQEQLLMEQQEKNACGESTGKVIRSVLTSAATIGTGLLAGVPVGDTNYDSNNTAIDQASQLAKNGNALDESHRTFWSAIKGGQFAYNHNEGLAGAVNDSVNGATATGSEIEHVRNIMDYLNDTLNGKFGSFSLNTTEMYGQTTHELGRALANVDWLKIGAAGAYLLGDMFSHGRNKEEPTPSPDPYEHRKKYEPTIAPYETGKTLYEIDGKLRPTIGDDGEPIPPDREKHEKEDYEDVMKAGVSEVSPERLSDEELEDPAGDTEKIIAKEEKAIDKYEDKMSEKYRKTVETVAETLPPMKKECRFSVCVPAAYSEHRVIYGYLASFLGQERKVKDPTPLNPDLYEINIFVNGTNDKAGESAQTVAEINRFKSEHPEMNVNVISKSYEKRQPLGYLRKVVNDQALLRSRDRESQDGPLYLVSHDADVKLTDKNYFARALGMDEKYETKVLAGFKELTAEAKTKYPFIWVARRLWLLVDLARISSLGEANFDRKAEGNNSFLRAESYALANGYNSHDKVAEDLNISAKMKDLYSGQPDGNKAIAGLDLRVSISERRDLSQVAKGETLYEGYTDFHNDDSVREDFKIDESEITKINPDNEAIFKKYLERELSAQYTAQFRTTFFNLSDRTPEVMKAKREGKGNDEIDKLHKVNMGTKLGADAAEQTNKIMKKAGTFLGISFTTVLNAGKNGYECEITDWTKLKEGLKPKPKE